MKISHQKMRRTVCSGTAVASLLCLFGLHSTAANAASNKISDGSISSSQQTIDHKIYQVDKVKIDAPPESVWAILTNYVDSPKVYSKVTNCTVLSADGDKKLVAFKVKAFRDLMTLDYTLNIHERFPTSIEWSRNCGAFKANEGYWHLEPADEGKSCLVTYAKFVDGGAIPQYFVNKELKADMPLILASVKICAETSYQNSLHENIIRHEHEKEERKRTSSTNITRVPTSESERIVETSLSLRGTAHRGL